MPEGPAIAFVQQTRRFHPDRMASAKLLCDRPLHLEDATGRAGTRARQKYDIDQIRASW